MGSDEGRHPAASDLALSPPLRPGRRLSLQERRGTLSLKLEGSTSSPEPSCLEMLKADGYVPGATISRSTNRGFNVVSAQKAGKEFAVKQTDERPGDGLFRSMLVTEFRILRKLQHPYIVTAINLYEANSGCAFLMERCTGSALLHLLPFDSWLSLGRRWTVLDQILDAVGYLHSNCVAHRDLHAANIIVAGDAEVGLLRIKVIDFGSARTTETMLSEEGNPLAFKEDVDPRILPPSPNKFRRGSPQQSVPADHHATPGNESRAPSFALDIFAAGLLMTGLLQGKEGVAGQVLEESNEEGVAVEGESVEVLLQTSGLQLVVPSDFVHKGPAALQLLTALLSLEWHQRPSAMDARRMLHESEEWSSSDPEAKVRD